MTLDPVILDQLLKASFELQPSVLLHVRSVQRHGGHFKRFLPFKRSVLMGHHLVVISNQPTHAHNNKHTKY